LESLKAIRELTKLLGPPIRSGREYRFCSPFQEHFKNPLEPDEGHHLYVNPDKKVWICYKSSLAGSLKNLFERLNAEFEDDGEPDPISLDDLKKRLAALHSRSPTEIVQRAPLPEWAVPAVLGTSACNYLFKRGLTMDDIDTYRIHQGTGEHVNWVVMPTFGEDGQSDFWAARCITEKRYLNPKSPRKWHVGYLHIALKTSRDLVVLCEGAFSAIAAGRNAVCTYGKFVTDEQLWRLYNADIGELAIALDPDAKVEAMDTIAKAIRMGFRKVSYVAMPEGFDPADLGRDLFAEYLKVREVMTPVKVLRNKFER
jgi:hypothetical protein